MASRYGMDRERLDFLLQYQILADYVLTDTDRHMNNIGFLRDADTLKIIDIAPLFDSGHSLFVGGVVAAVPEEFQNIPVNSFCATEKELLRLVPDKKLLDLSVLPSPDRLEELYRKDSKISQYRIGAVRAAYETKIQLLEKMQR